MGRLSTASLLSFVLLLSIASAQTGTGTGTPTPAETASTTLSCDRFHKTGFWDVDIDNWPALPPACGPPLSANALRDRSKLPIQICSIVASYVLFVLVIGTLLVTTGRRMRRSAEQSTRTLEIEMVHPGKQFEPTSPAVSQRSWFRGPLKNLRSSGISRATTDAQSPQMISPPLSPGGTSMVSFDGKAVDQYRESRQTEMERLYAAVMAHEDAKRSTGRLSNVKSIRSDDGIEANPPAPIEARRKLRVQISESSISDSVPKSPYKAIYPPYSPGAESMGDGQSPGMTPITPRTPGHNAAQYDMWPLPSPTTPLSPRRIDLPNDMYPASPPPQQVKMQFATTHDRLYQAPPQVEGSRKSSSSGSGRSRKLGLKNLRIGAPQPRTNSHDEDDREPLTPRLYNPPAPPNPPEYGVRFQEPQSAKSVDTYTSERLDQVQPLPIPSAQPQRRPSNLTLSLPATPGANKSASSSVNTLPLRAFQSQENMSQVSNPLSPGPIKTTFLERNLERIGRGPMTGRTPRTGVPQTPYSAYMPFTPITPVTPGLVSRKERKERIKAEGKKVLVEEDEVKDKEDMWDAGY